MGSQLYQTKPDLCDSPCRPLSSWRHRRKCDHESHYNWDLGIGKDFKFTERIAFQFRAEAFNVFNHAQYGFDPTTSTGIGAPVDNNPNDKAYGRVTAAHPGRIIQLGGKITF